jgi:hypothetical protein
MESSCDSILTALVADRPAHPVMFRTGQRVYRGWWFYVPTFLNSLHWQSLLVPSIHAGNQQSLDEPDTLSSTVLIITPVNCLAKELFQTTNHCFSNSILMETIYPIFKPVSTLEFSNWCLYSQVRYLSALLSLATELCAYQLVSIVYGVGSP